MSICQLSLKSHSMIFRSDKLEPVGTKWQNPLRYPFCMFSLLRHHFEYRNPVEAIASAGFSVLDLNLPLSCCRRGEVRIL